MKLATFGTRPQIIGMIVLIVVTFAAIWYLSNVSATAGVANKLRSFMGLAPSTQMVA
jgi:hypothetical protein